MKQDWVIPMLSTVQNNMLTADSSCFILALTPICLQALESLFAFYLIREMAAFLQEGFASGFRIAFYGRHLPTECGSLRLARILPEVVRKKVANECAEG